MTKTADSAKADKNVELAKKTLNKYQSPALIAKLEENKVFGASKVAVIQILEERKVDVKKWKTSDGKEVEIPTAIDKKLVAKDKAANNQDLTDDEATHLAVEKAAKSKKAPAKEEKAAKPAKEKAEKAPKKVKEAIVAIDPTDAKIAAILKDNDLSKSDKIRKFLGMGYSVSQVAKQHFPKLDAHYSFVFGIKQKMDNGEVPKVKKEKVAKVAAKPAPVVKPTIWKKGDKKPAVPAKKVAAKKK